MPNYNLTILKLFAHERHSGKSENSSFVKF